MNVSITTFLSLAYAVPWYLKHGKAPNPHNVEEATAYAEALVFDAELALYMVKCIFMLSPDTLSQLAQEILYCGQNGEELHDDFKQILGELKTQVLADSRAKVVASVIEAADLRAHEEALAARNADTVIKDSTPIFGKSPKTSSKPN